MWHLYDQEVLQEDAILRWDDEKKDADELDKVFVKQAEKFIQVSLLFTLFEASLLLFAHLKLAYVSTFSAIISFF